MLRQVLYISTAQNTLERGEADAILATSRRRNADDRITGLLYFDGKRFLQALEGESDTLDTTLARIEKDGRHRAIVILSDRMVEAREFGDWAMAYRPPGSDIDVFLTRIGDLVAGASPSVRATFTGFAEARRAA